MGQKGLSIHLRIEHGQLSPAHKPRLFFWRQRASTSTKGSALGFFWGVVFVTFFFN
jgi:hypothetical protein